MKILLDYFFPVTVIEPTAQASTAYLKQVCLVVAPKDGSVETGVVTECVSSSEVAALTNNTEATQLFAAGMTKVYILPVDDLYLEEFIASEQSKFFTLLISSDFDKDDIIANQAQGTITVTNYANLVSGTDDSVTIGGVTLTAQTGAVVEGENTFQAATGNSETAASLAAQINAHATLGALVEASVVGAVVTVKAKDAGSPGNDIAVSYTDNDTNVGITLAGLSGGKLAGGDGLVASVFKGVIGVSSTDDDFLADQAAIANRCAFHSSGSNGAKNMCYAFGKMLSNVLSWRNQQYITAPFADDVDELGEANSLFDDKISFVLSDDEYGQRLGLFCCGGKAIVAPYIIRNLIMDLQSGALTYISGNQPDYSHTEAALLEDELQKVVQSYIDRKWIQDGTIEIKLEQDNFVASGYVNVAEPKAFWRIFGELRQTL